MAKITDLVASMAAPIVEGAGCSLWDVEYVREAGEWFLRIYIDKEGGVDLADCQSISEKAGEILDEKDIIPDNYMLEVSSPGLDRVLKKDKDFRHYAGSDVDVKLFAPLEEAGGGKAFTAHLEGLTEEGDLALTLDGGKEIALHRDKISQVRLHFSF